MTDENTDLFLAHIEMEQMVGKELTIKKLQVILNELPEIYYSVLKELIYILVKVNNKNELNKMDSKNLSLIFGPNIFNHQNALDLMRPDNPAIICTQYFIDNFYNIFN